MTATAPSPLPPGRLVELGTRGRTFVREAGAHHGGPTLLLLHGWTATADLNFSTVYEPLARHHHVIALDHHGHGRGVRNPARFRLETCADDAARLCRELGLDRVIPVGYSMGGLVAQLVWRRHRDLVTGLVLCATSRNFAGNRRAQLMFGGVNGLSTALRATPPSVRRSLTDRFRSSRVDTYELPWEQVEVSRHDPAALIEAAAAIGRFTSHDWIGDVDVPTAVVVNTADTTVPTHRQHKLAASIPDARTFTVDGDHRVIGNDPKQYAPVLSAACRHVTDAARAPG
ncbi:MAG: alpha/beta hydrolase [Actinomycetota bacterium]|nr:alpha/beta hydrolase [Actinomycetota bacterium]